MAWSSQATTVNIITLVVATLGLLHEKSTPDLCVTQSHLHLSKA
jgi:hypothetical protein